MLWWMLPSAMIELPMQWRPSPVGPSKYGRDLSSVYSLRSKIWNIIYVQALGIFHLHRRKEDKKQGLYPKEHSSPANLATSSRSAPSWLMLSIFMYIALPFKAPYPRSQSDRWSPLHRQCQPLGRPKQGQQPGGGSVQGPGRN